MSHRIVYSKFLTLLVLCAVPFVLSACDEDDVNTQSFMGGMEIQADMAMESAPRAMMSKSASVRSAPASSMALDRSGFKDRRIAETHSMSVRIVRENLKQRFDRDLKKCLVLGCEVSNSNINSDNGGHINAKIDPKNLGEFLDFLAEGPGKLLSHQIRADDKTLQFVDTQAKLENKKALRDRLRVLLSNDRTKRVEDILKIERELARVEGEIDSLTGSLRHLSTITSMATLNVSYQVDYTQIETRTADIGQSFKQAWYNLVDSASNVVEFIGGVLPWIPVFVIGLWGGIMLIRLFLGGVIRKIFKTKK
jgi:hypothetical protein